MAMQIWLNIISGNCSLPDGTNPLSKPMLTLYERYLIHLKSTSQVPMMLICDTAGNVALRWVYQAILVEMTDKTLYGLRATQRHKEIRGIFNGGV